MIKPEDSIWIAYVVSNDDGEVIYIGIVPPDTEIKDVEWPEWSRTLNNYGENRYKFRVDPPDVFLDEWIRNKLKRLRINY